MRNPIVKVRLWCSDTALRDYLQRVLERCEEIQVVLPPHAEPVEAEVVVDGFLTPLEVSRLQSLADYGSVGRAAHALCISERTLQNELASIRSKLGVKSTLEAVVWAFRKGLVR